MKTQKPVKLTVETLRVRPHDIRTYDFGGEFIVAGATGIHR